MKLKPATYQFKTTDYPKWGLSNGKQIGLIADEVKQVFPELVKEAVHPAEYGKDKTELLHAEVKYEGINYIGLIPVLISAIQEQQKTITDMKAENEELKSRLTKIEQNIAINSNTNTQEKIASTAVSLSSASLEQNVPNPFNRNTVINYYLPQQAGNAVINITDMNGNVIKVLTITQPGNGQLMLEAGQLLPGSYKYSLFVNGRLIGTKQMILTK